MKKLEDFRLPEVGSEKVKACMQEAVKRALQWQKDIEADGESQPITVGVLRGTFRTLSDCDFENRACANYRIKKIVDTVINDITADEFLDMLNDAYAIAIHAANTDYPEYEIRSYRDMADRHLRSTHARDMVLGFAAYLLKECAQCDNTPDILKSEFASEIHITLLGLHCLDVLCEEGPEYDLHEQKDLDNLKKRLNPPPHPVEKLLDAMVRYAENFTANEWSKKRVIGHMIHSKGAAGRYIPYDVYQKYEKRIDALAMFPEPEKKYSEDNNKSSQVAQEIEPQKTHAAATAQDQTGTDASNSTDATPPSQSGRGHRATDTPTNISATQGSPKDVIRKGDYLIFPSLEQQQYWAQLFVDFLRAHNKSQESLSTKLSNYVNRAFACFYHQWKKSNLLNTNPYNKAYTMFLVNDCGITGIAEKTYSNNVIRILDEAFEQNSSMQIDIESIVKKEVEQLTS